MKIPQAAMPQGIVDGIFAILQGQPYELPMNEEAVASATLVQNGRHLAPKVD